MAARFETVWQTAKFLDSLQRLARRQPALRQRVFRVLDRYYERLDALDRTIIHNPKRRVFHTAIDKEKRLIDEPLDPARPGEVAVLYVDHHDAANEWAARYRGDTLAMIERATRVERQAAVGGVRAPRHVSEGTPEVAEARATPDAPRVRAVREDGPRSSPSFPRGSLGERIGESKLIALGVPREVVRSVAFAAAETDLTIFGLSPEVAQRVGSWYASKARLPRVRIPVPALEPIEAIPVRREELQAVLTLNLSQLLASLTSEQHALARRPSRNLYVVKGAAGSGKTIVGVRRIEYLREQRDVFEKLILFLCYNKVLANAARQMIEDTLQQSLTEARVEVRVAYELMSDLAQEHGLVPPRSGYCAPERLLPLVPEARRADSSGVLAAWSDRAILDEILEVIYGRVLGSVAEYATTNRKGRGRRLDRVRQRPVLWAIHEQLRAACDRRGVAPWDALPAQVARHLSAHPPTDSRFAAVVIDEAQDLLPSIFQVVLALQAGQDENMLVLGDAAQNVYRSGFRWGHTGLRPSPSQVTYLRRCFRSTRSIIEAAAPLISRQQSRLEGDLVIPEGEGEAGPKVRVTIYPTVEEELQSVAVEIGIRIEQGVPPSSIAVLLDSAEHRAALRQHLERLQCSSEDFLKDRNDRRIDIFDQSVKLLAVSSAKGIEFQVVFVPLITGERFPGADDDGESADRARRVLYTAMTRCAWELCLSAHARDPSRLLSELDSSQLVWEDRVTVHPPSVDTRADSEATAAGASVPEPELGSQVSEPSTVERVMQLMFGSPVRGGPPRFRESGWKYEGLSEARCSVCASRLHVLRKPYLAAGKSYRYWAISCAACGSAAELAAFSGEQQKRIRMVGPPSA